MPYGIPPVAFGIMLCSFGSIFAALALTLQTMTHRKDEDRDDDKKKFILLRWKWWLGFCMLLIPGVLEGWAYSWAPLSVIAPLSGETIFFNILCSTLILKEETNYVEMVSCIVIVAGIVLTCVFGSRESPDYTVDELVSAFESEQAIIYNCVVAVILGASVTGAYWSETPLLKAFCFANIAGLCGGQQNGLLKASAELVKTSIGGDNQFDNYKSWLIVIACICCAILQISFLNRGLATYDQITYVPIYQAMITIWGVVAGGIYFDEFKNFTVLQFFMFFTGLTCIAGGILILAFNPKAGREERMMAEKQQTEKHDLEAVVPPVEHQPSPGLIPSKTGMVPPTLSPASFTQSVELDMDANSKLQADGTEPELSGPWV